MNTKSYDLSLISKYRNYIFGISILGIIIFHSSIIMPVSLPVLTYIKNTGNMGVDIFLFLSAMGLYYSYNNNENIKMFYLKRLKRVLIPYIIVVPLFFSFQIEGFTDFIKNITLFTFFRYGNRTEWFIATILVLYLIFPFLYKLMKKYHMSAFILLMLCAFGINGLLYCFSSSIYENVEIASSRIPIFLIGCFIAPYIKNGVRIKRAYVYTYLMISLIFFCYCYFYPLNGAIYRYSYIPLSIAFIISLTLLFDRIGKKTPYIMKILNYFGSRTLELYLIHEKILILAGLLPIVADRHNFIFNIFVFIITVILAELLYMVIASIRHNFECS